MRQRKLGNIVLHVTDFRRPILEGGPHPMSCRNFPGFRIEKAVSASLNVGQVYLFHRQVKSVELW